MLANNFHRNLHCQSTTTTTACLLLAVFVGVLHCVSAIDYKDWNAKLQVADYVAHFEPGGGISNDQHCTIATDHNLDHALGKEVVAKVLATVDCDAPTVGGTVQEWKHQWLVAVSPSANTWQASEEAIRQDDTSWCGNSYCGQLDRGDGGSLCCIITPVMKNGTSNSAYVVKITTGPVPGTTGGKIQYPIRIDVQ